MNSSFDNSVNLHEADSVEITTIMDDYTDTLLESTNMVKRPRLAVGERISQMPLAEHGLSMLIKVFRGSGKAHHTFRCWSVRHSRPFQPEIIERSCQ